MAENVDPDMPPALSAIFRRRESAGNALERAPSTTLYRKSIVDTFYPPEAGSFSGGNSVPIVIQAIRKPGAPAPPPRSSSLSAEIDIENLPPPPPELLDDQDEFPPPPPSLEPDVDSSKEVLADALNPPPPPSSESEVDTREEDQRYLNQAYYEEYTPRKEPKHRQLTENSIYEGLAYEPSNQKAASIGPTLVTNSVTTLPRALARRNVNKPKRVVELQQEGKNAIDSPGSPTNPDLPPDDYILEEYEERSMIEPSSYDDPRLKELITVLIDWINDELATLRIIVKDIEEDLYDGQILQKLLEKLSGVKLDVVEVTQSEELQKQKLQTVLDAVNKILGLPRWNQNKWSVENIHSKNVVSIIHLLVTLVRHFRAPIRLPENVSVNVVIVQKKDGRLQTRKIQEELTSTYDDLGMRVERDAFDTLFDHAPDKLQVVKQSLVSFVNKHLNRINLEVNDLDSQFHDGVYLTLLMGLLEGYFVPLYSFQLTPTLFEQKVANVALAFELMMEAGLGKPKARPEDLVNLDLKSTLRVLYNLFTKYKGVV